MNKLCSKDDFILKYFWKFKLQLIIINTLIILYVGILVNKLKNISIFLFKSKLFENIDEMIKNIPVLSVLSLVLD